MYLCYNYIIEKRRIKEYTNEKEEELKVKVVEVIEMKENFPIQDEAYVVGLGENGKYFFAWGYEYPYEEEVPQYDMPDGTNGIEWYESEELALVAMKEAAEAMK